MSYQLSIFSDFVPDEPKNNKSKEKPQKKENQEIKTEKTEGNKDIELVNDKEQNISKKTLEEQIIEIENSLELSIEDKAINIIEEAINKKINLDEKDKNSYHDQLKAICLNCYKCKLADTRKNVVFSSGEFSTAKIMIIGEGPGQNEDEKSLPFIGRAGQLLTKILNSGGIDREKDVYITNVVKCRPPENRVPEKDEVDACSKYLKNQIDLSSAEVILLTGSTAMKHVLGYSKPISKVRGEWIEWNGKMVMPIFHPAYLLRNQSKDIGSPKWLMWQDIKKVNKLLNKKK